MKSLEQFERTLKVVKHLACNITNSGAKSSRPPITPPHYRSSKNSTPLEAYSPFQQSSGLTAPPQYELNGEEPLAIRFSGHQQATRKPSGALRIRGIVLEVYDNPETCLTRMSLRTNLSFIYFHEFNTT